MPQHLPCPGLEGVVEDFSKPSTPGISLIYKFQRVQSHFALNIGEPKEEHLGERIAQLRDIIVENVERAMSRVCWTLETCSGKIQAMKANR